MPKQSKTRIKSGDSLRALLALSEELSTVELSLPKVLQTISIRTAELVGDTCTISLVSDDEQLLRVVAWYHPDPQALALLQEMTKTTYRAEQGPHWKAIESLQPVLLENLPQESLRASEQPDIIPYLDRFRIYDVLIAPLVVQGKALGTLAVSRDRPGISYSREQQDFIITLAGRAALAISNAQLFSALQDELLRRKQAEAELIELQGRLMDSVEIERLHLASKLHDEAVQGLYGVLLTLGAVRGEINQEAIQTPMDTIKEELIKVINLLRITYREMRPPVLVSFGLNHAIASHADLVTQENHGLTVQVDLEDDLHLGSEQTNDLRFDVAERVKVQTSVPCAATSNRVELSRFSQHTWLFGI
jgi:GAF domain-containing protein